MRERVATPHMGGDAISHWELGSLAGAGAMISTDEGLIRFGTVHWNSNTPVDLTASLAEVTKPRISDQGLGWAIDGDNLWHKGAAVGLRSDLKVIRKVNTASVVLVDSGGVSHKISVDGNIESLHGYWSGFVNVEFQKLRLQS